MRISDWSSDVCSSDLSGEVQVEFTVAADGSVTSARVVRANTPRVFDREAVAAVKRWRFEPTGQPVTTRRPIGFTPGGQGRRLTRNCRGASRTHGPGGTGRRNLPGKNTPLEGRGP